MEKTLASEGSRALTSCESRIGQKLRAGRGVIGSRYWLFFGVTEMF